MKVPLSWLKQYVSVEHTPEDLARLLTMAGIEVGAIQKIGEWSDVCVGEVMVVTPHPNADRLRLVQVKIDSESTSEPLPEVVCGAPNVAVGQKIAYASIGAVLVDGHTGEPGRKLKRAKIRGVTSEGMVCSARELGLGANHDGILVLNKDLPVGLSLTEAIGDIVFDIDITPNRPDCMSIIGVAREVAALTQARLILPALDYPTSSTLTVRPLSVAITEPSKCVRYMAAVIFGVKVGPSPEWLRNWLENAGERSINNVVDITNFVMLEQGQPLHPFDLDTITNSAIIVRAATPGEKLTTLDGSERILRPEDLVIADAQRAIALAGIMGGANTEITDNTSAVVLEAASFEGTAVRKTAKRLNISSSAVARFEKRLNPALTENAIKRATQFILKICGGETAAEILDEYPGKAKNTPKATVFLPKTAPMHTLGVNVKASEIKAYLELLGFELTAADNGWQITVPIWRSDIAIPEDLCEELARMIGYDNLPSTPLSGVQPTRVPNLNLEIGTAIVNAFERGGMQEIITYSAIPPEAEKNLPSTAYLPPPIVLRNPVSAAHSVLRRTLRVGVLQTMAENSKNLVGSIRLFEYGNIFSLTTDNTPLETLMLVGVVAGTRAPLHWDKQTQGTVDFYDARGVLESTLQDLGISAKFTAASDPDLVVGRTAHVSVSGQHLGVLGEVPTTILSTLDSRTSYAVLFEIDVVRLREVIITRDVARASSPPRTPYTVRDIALLVDEHVTTDMIREPILRNKTVVDTTVFDVYRGQDIPPGKKSVAVKIKLQDPHHTLNSATIDRVVGAMVKGLKRNLNAQQR